jgi:hypothetical protein
VQISSDQLRQLGVLRAHSLAEQCRISTRANGASDPPEAAARLAALANDAVASLAPLGALGAIVAVDVHQTADWLKLALDAGFAYRETRAAALLHGAAALGALWFIDERLLPASEMLPAQATMDRTIGQLLAAPQEARFQRAAEQELRLRDGLRFALGHAFADGLSDEALRELAAAAFAVDAPEGNEPEPGGAQGDGWVEEMTARFMARERAALNHAGVSDPALVALCIAGDLTLGLGRCVRLLTRQRDKLDAAGRLAWLERAVHELAELAR